MIDDLKYLPVLSLSPAEMLAFSELPDKDRKSLIPYVKLKGWLAAKELSNSIKKLESLEGRKIILDLDYEYVFENKDYLVSGSFPRPVYEQLKKLMNPEFGYKNWMDFVLSYDWLIPVVQTKDFEHVVDQCRVLEQEGRDFVLRFSLGDIESGNWLYLIEVLSQFNPCLIIFDIGKIDINTKSYENYFFEWLERAEKYFSGARFCITGSSFPDSFGDTEKGEVPIYERQIYNSLCKEFERKLIYSDYASARVKEGRSGGGVPIPRIDFPLKNSWCYVRYRDGDVVDRSEKYKWAASRVMEQEYWPIELKVWGVQMIELTARGSEYAISSPMKSTAVRINMHLYNQLHYHEELSEVDSDDDWED